MQCVLAALQWVWRAVTGHGSGFFALNSRALPLGGIRAVLAMSARAQQGSCSPSTSRQQGWLPAPEPVGAFCVPAPLLCHSQQRMEAPCSAHPAGSHLSAENLAICGGTTPPLRCAGWAHIWEAGFASSPQIRQSWLDDGRDVWKRLHGALCHMVNFWVGVRGASSWTGCSLWVPSSWGCSVTL